MTAEELVKKFNDTYPPHHEWPKTYEVDAETYANCCQYVFSNCRDVKWGVARIALGLNRGLMFRNVELILA